MMNFLRKHMRKIFLVTILAFLGGTFVGGGAYLFGPEHDFKTAASVNGKKIPMNIFNAYYNNSVEMYRMQENTTPSDEIINELKAKNLQVLVQDEVFYQKAQEYGIQVSDSELMEDIRFSLMFRNRNSNTFDPKLYYGFLNTLRIAPKDYEEFRRKQIAGEKLKILLASSVKAGKVEFETAKAQNPELTFEEYSAEKTNRILNEWYIDTVRNSKISSNDAIFN